MNNTINSYPYLNNLLFKKKTNLTVFVYKNFLGFTLKKKIIAIFINSSVFFISLLSIMYFINNASEFYSKTMMKTKFYKITNLTGLTDRNIQCLIQ